MYQAIDPKSLSKSFHKDLYILKKYILDFITESNKIKELLSLAIQARNKENICFLCHKLKGLVSVFEYREFIIFLKNSQKNVTFDIDPLDSIFQKILMYLDILNTDLQLFLDKELNAKKVLLVDDNESYLNLISSLLSDRGFNVRTLADPSIVLDFIKNSDVKIIVLDISMPIISGLEVLKEIRKCFSKDALSVVMLSGLESIENLRSALNFGANEFISKDSHVDFIAERLDIQFNLLNKTNQLKKYTLVDERISKIKDLCLLMHQHVNAFYEIFNDIKASSRPEDVYLLEQLESKFNNINYMYQNLKTEVSVIS